MAGKKTKIKEQVKTGKKLPGRPAIPQLKSVKISEQTGYNMRIGWNVHSMDVGGSFSCSLADLHQYQAALADLERYTVSQVLQIKHNHPLPYSKMSDAAQKRLDALNLDIETLYQLNLGTPVRIWGVFDQNIFQILWLDPEHKVYKS